ncbi:MAG: hypothetical protein ACRECY_15040, partial [Phyllobacterium sp.]
EPHLLDRLRRMSPASVRDLAIPGDRHTLQPCDPPARARPMQEVAPKTAATTARSVAGRQRDPRD